MFSILGKVKEAQEKMKIVQQNLVKISTTVESDGGLVKVTINGHKKVTNVEIDKSILGDKDKVQLLILETINKAITTIDAQTKAEISKSMQGALPNIPGIDLNAIMGGMS